MNYELKNRYAIPVVTMDGEKYYKVQNRDWHIGDFCQAKGLTGS